MTARKTMVCPHCGESVDMRPANRYRPFCSRRCKLIDLGDWLDESHRIADPEGTAPSAPWDGAARDNGPGDTEH